MESYLEFEKYDVQVLDNQSLEVVNGGFFAAFVAGLCLGGAVAWAAGLIASIVN